MRLYDPSEMTVGPMTAVSFRSNPIALPRRTCLLAFGPGLQMIVRVDEVDGDGVAYGHRLGLKKHKPPKKVRGSVRAVDLIDAGLRAKVRNA